MVDQPPSDTDPSSGPGDPRPELPVSQPVPAQRMDRRTQVISWLWAVSPLVTVGLAAPVTFLWAAQRVRSRHYLVAAVVYAALVLLGLTLPNEDIGFVFLTIAWLASTAHALAVRSSVFRGQAAAHQETAIQAATRAAGNRRDLRNEARRIATNDPDLASELNIGRPDLPRDFDDGGLVDVNSAPAEVLMRLPGMTAAMAERVVQTREIRGPYSYLEELSVFADLQPELTDRLADYLLFLR